jgi:non-ribosomal peptide synthetase component F
LAVHRLIETRAATHGDTIAFMANGLALSYRQLNQRANAVARHLMDAGFRRGQLATVRMPRSAESATVLLAILKAGGMFVFIDEERDADVAWPRGVSFAETANADEVRYRTVDLTAAFERHAASSANLPVVSRGSDIACVIPDRDGSALVLVPHSTILALKDKPVPRFAEWSGDAWAMDLWMALMDGATVRVTPAALEAAA